MTDRRDVGGWTGLPATTRRIRTITTSEMRAYALAVATFGAALAITRLTWPFLSHTPFILFFAAVFATANWGSEGAGVVTIVLTALASSYIAPPSQASAISDISLGVFLVGAVIGNRIVRSRATLERKLSESEAHVRASWDSAAVGTAVLTAHGQVERLNPAMERLLDYPSAAWSGTSFGYFTHPDDAAAERAHFDQLMAGAVDDYQIEQRFRRRDGAIIWGRVTMSAVKDTSGRATGALMMIEDVTSRRLAENALRDSEEKLRGLFESVPVGLFQASPDGMILAANPALVGMLGYESAEALQRSNIADLYGDAGMRAAVRETLAAHRPEIPNTQTLLERRDGGFITAVIGARAVRDQAGVIRSYEGNVLDLSDRQALELQLYHAQKQEALGRLVSGVVHDFSNLLTAIGGSTELAMRDAAPGQRDDLEDILKASHRAAALTRQLMSFSRREKLEPQVLDLNAVIRDSGSLLSRLVGPDVQISLSLADDVKPIKGHVAQIEQILVNLAANARDAMPAGGQLIVETANVSTGTAVSGRRKTDRQAPSGGYVRLTIRDTGIGMDEQTKARLFEPFFTTKEEEGTGLGLATVHSIVNRASGRIVVESEPGSGTTFKIDFPAAS